eukprot:TRINITY_DN42673_c0_g1_i18.p1 TRINITY_DN42673_c0_g1~~TRINITY_DN42673_c0_g1_i18.p1  ORF type:complete len:760 (+),score=189.88 TRINITY_DN42673_c0_g1_i18:236-2515(+)
MFQNKMDTNIFANVIIRLGVFHLTCAFMSALGKSLRCSGFEDIIIESGICASGSINQVISGKNYNRALRVHKRVLEAMERLLLQAFETESEPFDNETRAILLTLAKDPSDEMLSMALQNDKCKELLSRLSHFRERVRMGELGKTPQFWLTYMDRVRNMLELQRATKENDLPLHLASLQNMCKLFFSYDHPNYARYTAVYLQTILNLPTSHPGAENLLREKGFSVNRSAVPGSRTAVDITIEQTINRHAKSQGGIKGFSTSQKTYHRWVTTRHDRALYHQATLESVDMDSQENTAHKDLRPSQVTQSDADTVKVMQAVNNFVNPFQIENKNELYCLSSGAPAPKDVENDLLSADRVGEEAYRQFVKERLLERTVSFNVPIKKLNLKTFAKTAKSVKVSGKSKKTHQITAERNVFSQLVLLAVNHNISMERALQFPLGPVPWSLAMSDGTPAKTDKAKLLHLLETESHRAEKPASDTNTYVIDGNAMFQQQVALPTTFGELAEQIFDKLPKVSRVDFVTDSYRPNSIKGSERNRRGTSKKHLVKGPATKVPRDWKTFLSNDENKTSFTRFLLEEWKKDNNRYAPKLQGRQVLFVCQEKCVRLTTVNGQTTLSEEVEELCSNHEEADTRIVLHCLHIAASAPDDATVSVRSPDTDVFVLLLKFSQTIKQTVLFDTGTGDKRRLLDVKLVAADTGEDICQALPALHAYTGCDSTSAFVRKGKVTALKMLQKNAEFLEPFMQLGTFEFIPESLFNKLEEFTCRL